MKTLAAKTFLFALSVSLAITAMGQKPAPVPPIKPFEYKWTPAIPGEDSEKSIAADKNVNLTLCVNEGSLKINGWSRNEVRMLVRGGSTFRLKVQAKGTSGLPALVSVQGYSAKSDYAFTTECISADEIELDAPVGTTINIKGREIRTVVDTVRKASVNVVGGDIILRNVSESVWASTGRGDITVEESQGPMTLSTTTGNVVVFDVGPHDIGDVFKAKTNGGNLSLQEITFRQVEVNSISGSIMLSGGIPSGAGYSIGTNNGSIRLQIPEKSSFQLSAIFSSDNFSSEVPYKLVTENIQEGSVKNIVAKYGMGGDATVRLTTNRGIIGIRKQ
jgi:hypothetical protein